MPPVSLLDHAHLSDPHYRLAVTYLIHLDGNSSGGAGGFDYRWQDLLALTRHLSESPLYVFHYLKKWQRNARLDSMPPAKARLYLTYFQYIAQEGGDEMSHARTLTELFWKFYCAKRKQGRLNSNSILRPLSVAAKALRWCLAAKQFRMAACAYKL